MASFRKAWPEVMQELDDESQGGRGRGLQLLEEYDPEDETSEHAVSRPWAFVCDYVKVLPTGKVKEVEPGDGASQGGGAGISEDVGVKSNGGPGGGKEKEVEGPQVKPTASVAKGPVLSMNITELIAQGPGSTPKAWEALADLRDKIAQGEKIDWWVIYNGDPERPFDDDSGYDDEEDNDVGEEVYENQQPDAKTFVPRAEAIRPRSAPSPALYAQARAQAQAEAPQMPKSIPKLRGTPPPPVPPAKVKEGGKRTRAMRAFPSLEKLRSHPPAPDPPPVPVLAVKPVTKTEGGLKKKFFGKR